MANHLNADGTPKHYPRYCNRGEHEDFAAFCRQPIIPQRQTGETVFKIPGTSRVISRKNPSAGSYKRARVSINLVEQPYPSEREILDQAVQLDHVQDNLYALDMIFSNAVAAAKILSEKRESTMIRLENHL